MSKHLDLEIRMTIQEGLKEKLTYAQRAKRMRYQQINCQQRGAEAPYLDLV